MTKTKKILLIVGAVLLAVCLAVALTFCGKPGNSDPSTQPSDAHAGEIWTFTIQVKAEGGMPLEGVGVYVYEDAEKTELTWFDKTDANGMISFTAPVKSSGYRYAFFSDVPAEYIAEEMYPITGKENLFVLKAAAIEDLDPENVRYELGDTIGDFTVVDTDGKEHKLSELLQSKKAVVLNFWYIECNPCKAEFPYLQEAYAKYSDQIEVIAMNPVNTNEADIAAFKSQMGLTFPVAMADPQWADMMQLTAFPTTVVIDRYGVISLIHKGTIDSTDTFEQVFHYFAAEDYVPGVVESLEDLPPLEEEDTLGTAENPDQQGAAGTKLTLKPGQEYHLEFYKASGMYMNVTGSDFYVIYEGKKTESASGYVGMMVESEGIYYPVKVVIGNPTDKEQNISIAFGALKGTSGNPYKLALGEFDMKTGAGNEEGVFGTYTAEKSGTLTVRCLRSSVSKYGFYLYNLRSYAMRNTNEDGAHDEDGYLYTSVQVKKGDKIQFSVAVDRDEDNVISAGAFRFELILEEGDGEENKKAEPPKTAYSITVTDQDGNAVAGVGVNLKGEFTYEPTETDPEDLEPTDVKVDLNLTTDAEGHIISEQVSGPYTATIRVPEGYRLEQTQYELTADTNTLTVQLQKIVMVDYTITVLDAEGNPVPGVSLMMGANFGTTNEEGVYTVNLEEAEYSVFVFAGVPEGYLTPADSFQIPVGESQLTIQLEKEAEPEPEYIDIFGEFPIVTASLTPGQKAYYNVYNAGGADLVIEDADAFVIVGEVTYEAVDGVVTAPIPVTMGRMPVQVIVGNGGTETESYTANVVFPVGSQQNPAGLTLGDVTAELAEGNSTGYYYTWTAAEDGALTVVHTGETGVAGETFDVMLTNNTSYECPMMSESEDGKSVTVAVKAGDAVTVLVSTMPDENWQYPANTVELNASFGQVHVHEYTAVVTEPTCTEEGYTTYTCACGDSYVGDEVAATGHKYEAVVTAPTCSEGGYTTFTCACGDSYVGNEVAATGHKYEAVVTAPTCTEGGYTTFTCVCGDSYVGDEVAAAGHKYESVVTAPTCSEGGYTTFTCACGDSYVGDEVAATGHKYEAVVTAPTCTAEGYTTYTCACGDTYVGDEVAATGHKHEAVVTAPTCTEGGYTTYTCACGDTYVGDKVAALGHDYTSKVIEPTTTTQGYTLHTCSRCGDSYKDNYTDTLPENPEEPPHVHSYTEVVTAPTCTEDGYTTYTCECGYSYVGNEVAATGHQYESVVTAPTCTEAGYTTFTCSVCKDSYVGDEVAATGHNYESVVTTPTCTEAGYTTFTCSVCKDSYVGDEVAATGHNYESVVTAPTCTEAGYTTFTCSVCKDSYVGDEVAATGHQYESVVTAPTCTEGGYTTFTCVCGDSYVGDEVAATGHNYESVVTAPTCTEGGYTTYTCACGDSYVGDEVAATGHNYESVVTAPTCTEDGYTTYTCACGDSYVDDKVAALGHDYTSEVIEPTTTTEGYTLHTCSRCGDSYKDNYTEKLPEEDGSVNYTVTVTGFDGTPMSGVAVQILKNGAVVKVGVTDASGKLAATLEPDSYQVKLAFSTTGNHYEESTAVLTENAPALTILVTSALPTTGVEDHWMLGKADMVGLGGTYVSIQKNVMTYFLFAPEEEGTYRFTTSDPEAVISYWGGENFPSNQTANTDYKDNAFTLSVNQSYIGQTYVIGITGADDCILIIERQGASAFNPHELPYTEYQLAEEPEQFTLVKDGTLTYVDLSAEAEDYQLVLGSDGYYHLGTADGPVMYVCLGGRAPYLSLYSMCGGGGVTGAPFRYTDYSDYDNIVKEDYTQCILDYGACMDKEYGVYPMTEDLVYILQKGVEYMQWAKPDSPNFLFAEVENFNPEMGWMFAVCYLVK